MHGIFNPSFSWFQFHYTIFFLYYWYLCMLKLVFLQNSGLVITYPDHWNFSFSFRFKRTKTNQPMEGGKNVENLQVQFSYHLNNPFIMFMVIFQSCDNVSKWKMATETAVNNFKIWIRSWECREKVILLNTTAQTEAVGLLHMDDDKWVSLQFII